MVIKEYPDGSELTVKNLIGAVVAGAVIATAIVSFTEWRENRKWKRYRGH